MSLSLGGGFAGSALPAIARHLEERGLFRDRIGKLRKSEIHAWREAAVWFARPVRPAGSPGRFAQSAALSYPPAMAGDPRSVDLLRSAYGGDRKALNDLLALHRGWLWSYVRRHMGAGLRAFETSEDVVQDVLRNLILRGPHIIPRHEDDFRRFVATIVVNRLIDRHEWIHADRRSRGQECGQDEVDGALRGAADRSQETPSRVAIRKEESDQVELALQLIDPDEAHLIRLREWEGLSFDEIGTRVGATSDTARKGFGRAVRSLGRMLRKLDSGDLSDLAPDSVSPAGR